MTSERRFFSGATLAQALNQAAHHYKVAPEDIRYKQIEKRHGFLRSRKKVMIEVNGIVAPTDGSPAPEAVVAEIGPEAGLTEVAPTGVRQPEATSEGPVAEELGYQAQGEAPSTESVPSEFSGSMLIDDDEEEAPTSVEKRDKRRGKRASHVTLPDSPMSASNRFPLAEGEEAEAAARALSRILAVAAVDLEHKILQGDDQLEVELWGEDQDILLRDRGRLLLAIQHLLPRAIRGLIGHSVVCRVDSDSFHEIREERLRDMAQRAADEVREEGRAKKLEPMSPDERRIVHLTLSDYPGVETESQGTGLFKRVMVRPADQAGSRTYNR